MIIILGMGIEARKSSYLTKVVMTSPVSMGGY